MVMGFNIGTKLIVVSFRKGLVQDEGFANEGRPVAPMVGIGDDGIVCSYEVGDLCHGFVIADLRVRQVGYLIAEVFNDAWIEFCCPLILNQLRHAGSTWHKGTALHSMPYSQRSEAV